MNRRSFRATAGFGPRKNHGKRFGKHTKNFQLPTNAVMFTCQLSLIFSTKEDEDEPSVLEIKMNGNGVDLFFLCSLSSCLKVYILHLQTMQFLPRIITHPMTVHVNSFLKIQPTMNISSLIKQTMSDYVILVVRNEVFFYSVASGKRVNIAGSPKITVNVGTCDLIEVDVSSDFRHIVFETPELPKAILWKYMAIDS